jgi:glycosyltransferase involved in cell wall biosynthesis
VTDTGTGTGTGTGAPRPLTGLTVPTPWYPTPFNRMGGSFVAQYARLVSRLADRVDVVHAQEWPGGTPAGPGQDVDAAGLRPAFDAVLDRMAADGGLRVSGAAGSVTRVPVFTLGGVTVAERAVGMVRDVRRVVGRFDTPIVHGHVGYYGGLLAARLADPAAKVFATEHSTGLREVLATPGGRDVYAEVLERATAVFCVSSLLRDQILQVLPEYASTVQVLANPVDFAAVPRRSERPSSLNRWVFAGGLIERKGVERLVRAFCAVARGNPAVDLTVYGEGPLADRLVATAREAGVAERLHLRGVVRHSRLLAELPQYDVLFAPSVYETFHLAVVEGVAAGLPVIVTRSGGPEEALAGVEDRVGRFVDVEESPDALVDAWQELSGALDGLDPDGARAELDARYGWDATVARLATAYGAGASGASDVAAHGASHGISDATSDGASAVLDTAPVPERIVMVAASAWRRYSVKEELAAARRLSVPTVVVTRDPEVTSWARGLRVVAPDRVVTDGDGGGPDASAAPVAPGDPLAVRARRLAGRVKRRVQGLPTAGPPRQARLEGDDLHGATVLVTDCQSMPVAERLIRAYPQVRLAVELDRRGRLGPPPDSPDSADDEEPDGADASAPVSSDADADAGAAVEGSG